MGNDYRNRVPHSAYVQGLHLKLPLILPRAAPNLEPRDEVWPTEIAPVIRAVEGGVELIQIPWGLAPSRPKTPVIINMRSEDRTFSHGRCLIPASAYYEFTGSKSPKTRWEVTKVGEKWFCFAGIVGQGRTKEREDVEAFSLLTVEPGADVASYHDRQPVILERSD